VQSLHRLEYFDSERSSAPMSWVNLVREKKKTKKLAAAVTLGVGTVIGYFIMPFISQKNFNAEHDGPKNKEGPSHLRS
jgi:hypothetical protein